jgi:hypothetical protein
MSWVLQGAKIGGGRRGGGVRLIIFESPVEPVLALLEHSKTCQISHLSHAR